MRKTPKCPICKTREVTVDVEGGVVSFFSWCDRCFYVVAAAPYCYSPACSSRVCGTRTVLANPGPEVTTENARYSCPNGCGEATATGWATGSGRFHAKADVERKNAGELDLTGVRLSDRGIARDYDAAHPVRRAYARAYVDTAKELLAA